MLTATRKSDGVKVYAWAEVKDRRPWECSTCRREAILKKGMVKTHHFAHVPPVLCEYGSAESAEHLACKMALYAALRADPRVSYCDLEHPLGPVRPDVYAVVLGSPLAIEVQASSLPLQRIIERTAAYAELKVPVLWLRLWSSALDEERFAPSIWEKWLHAAYLGRVYYWRRGLGVLAVHFDDFYTWVSAKSWHDSDGEERSAGGYEKRSKRYRKVVPAPQSVAALDWSDAASPANVHILSDMVSRRAEEWSGSKLVVPSRLVWIDNFTTWWTPRSGR